MFGLQELPNLGHYCTWAVTVDQDAESPVGVPEKLLNFSTAEIMDLNQTSIGNASAENMTIINETMVWF
jgi:hypothetical protein